MSAVPIANFLVEFASEPPPVASPVLAPAEPISDALDWEARLDEAYARGLVEGRQAIEATADARLEEQRASFAAELDAAREAWREEIAALSSGLGTALRDNGRQIGDAVAQALQPFLSEAVTKRAVEELCAILTDLTVANLGMQVEVTGPSDTFEAVRQGLPPSLADALKFTPGEGIEITVKAGASLLETRIGAWLEELRAELE